MGGAVLETSITLYQPGHKSTLSDHLIGISKKRYGGPNTVLTALEEKQVVASCVFLQKIGFPLTKEFVSLAIRDYLRENARPKGTILLRYIFDDAGRFNYYSSKEN